MREGLVPEDELSDLAGEIVVAIAVAVVVLLGTRKLALDLRDSNILPREQWGSDVKAEMDGMEGERVEPEREQT